MRADLRINWLIAIAITAAFLYALAPVLTPFIAAALLAYVLDTLPLPPFEVWLQDFGRNRFEHAVMGARHVARDATSRPVPVDRRLVRHRTRRWSARLELTQDGARWRGCIAFEMARGASPAPPERETPDAFRTTEIFVENNPRVIRDRFRSYHEETLRGFLRSVLP